MAPSTVLVMSRLAIAILLCLLDFQTFGNIISTLNGEILPVLLLCC